MLSKALWKDREGGAEQAKARAQYQKAREVERAKGQERLEKEKRRQQQAFQDAWNAKAEAEGNICKQNHTLAGTYLLAKSIARGGFLYSMLHVICMYMCMCLYMLYSILHMLYVCLCTCMHAYYKAFHRAAAGADRVRCLEVARRTEEVQSRRAEAVAVAVASGPVTQAATEAASEKCATPRAATTQI